MIKPFAILNTCFLVSSCFSTTFQTLLKPLNASSFQIFDDIKTDKISAFESDCIKYGIEVDDGWATYPVSNETRSFKEYEDSFIDVGETQYRTDIQHIILRYMDTQIYSYICRIVVNPVWKTRDWGFFGLFSRWDNWYFKKLKVYVDLPSWVSIGDWSPKTEPTSIGHEYGISIGYKEASISAGVSYVESLDITSRTNIATNRFETEYYYPFYDDYNHNSIVYFTMFNFEFVGDDYSLPVDIFPHINFETTYYGAQFFGNHARTFAISPFREIVPDDFFDVPTT